MTRTSRLGVALRQLSLAGATLLALAVPAVAQRVDLTLEERTVNINGTDRPAVTVNGQFPGPLIRLREGEEAVIRVTNRMRQSTASTGTG
jgi:FtsP/CotA-like multicopper oxidase with cupredoxin domain